MYNPCIVAMSKACFYGKMHKYQIVCKESVDSLSGRMLH